MSAERVSGSHTIARPRANRDLVPGILAAVLLVVLLVSLREILSPPVVLPFLLAGLWPLRRRMGVREAMAAAVLLTLIWVLRHYGGLMGPFLLALAVAYLLAPLVDRVEHRRVPRGLAIALVMIPLLAALVLLIMVTGPQVWDQATNLINALPQFVTRIIGSLEQLRDRLQGLPFLTSDQRSWLADLDAGQLSTLLQNNATAVLKQLAAWAWGFVQQLGTLLGFLGYVVITPVVTFYLLRDWRRLVAWAEGLLPLSRRRGVLSFLEEYDHSLGRFVRGQMIEAALVGVLTGVGLALLGVPSALLLGVLAGVFNLVPYIGLVVSAIPALVVALSMPDPVSGLLRVALVFGVVQFLDGSVTGPRIAGESAGLHPVAVMLALAFGGATLGFVGLLLAVPIALLIKMLAKRGLERYRGSEFYRTA